MQKLYHLPVHIVPDPHVVYVHLRLLIGTEKARQRVKESGHHKRSKVFWWAERELVLLDKLVRGGDRRDGCEDGGLCGNILVELCVCVCVLEGLKQKNKNCGGTALSDQSMESISPIFIRNNITKGMVAGMTSTSN